MSDSPLSLLELTHSNPVIPVIVIDDAALAVPLSRALLEGGISCAEVTFRTDAAAEALQQMATLSGMTVGAGTVLNATQAGTAVACGAEFLVSPGFSTALAEAAHKAEVPFLPGATNPTGIIECLDHGYTMCKFFPAVAMGGLPVVEALHAPFPHVRFVPTGGITPDNMSTWLAAPAVAALGGTWIAPRALISDRRWDEITQRAATAVARARETQPNQEAQA